MVTLSGHELPVDDEIVVVEGHGAFDLEGNRLGEFLPVAKRKTELAIGNALTRDRTGDVVGGEAVEFDELLNRLRERGGPFGSRRCLALQELEAP